MSAAARGLETRQYNAARANAADERCASAATRELELTTAVEHLTLERARNVLAIGAAQSDHESNLLRLDRNAVEHAARADAAEAAVAVLAFKCEAAGATITTLTCHYHSAAAEAQALHDLVSDLTVDRDLEFP